MGSVKDLAIVKKPTIEKMGIGEFHFSDRYSIFDWGEMPDHIQAKGVALCLMGAYCFEKLEQTGIKTHYRGLVTQKGETVRLEELKIPTNIMEINLVNVIRPKEYIEAGKLRYDYTIINQNTKNYLIPLEIIYRNGIPEGSSILKRLEQRSITPEDLGLDHYPRAGEKLAQPIFDVSTKLEDRDRYLTWQQAQQIAALTNMETEQIKTLLSKIDNMITSHAASAKLENEDGKIELAFDPERQLMVVDVVGTLDECRFTHKSIPVSKEIARQYYRRTRWYQDMDEAKKKAEAKGVRDWKTLCKTQPPKLDQRLKTIIEEMYMATANEITGHEFFDIHSLAQALREYQDYLGEKS
jgi:phosphoribosylaminoimidazole-succinocarboxamide synthase